ncbi:MAG: hypothetical protein IBX62_01065 [Coriobacteriia bacterium]|nr:hypothetical protein [Coriobacteriia bacterium]
MPLRPLVQSRKTLLEAALLSCRRQWGELGVSARSGGGQRWEAGVIDPEALLVFSLEVGRRDPRLFDGVLDWLVEHGPAIDISRLRRFVRVSPIAVRRLAAAVAEMLDSRLADPKWTALAETWIAEEADEPWEPQALFLGADGEPQAPPEEPDELFARHGFLRAPLTLRGMTAPLPVRSPALLRFRARALVGIGARAEVLTYLWTHEQAHGRLIHARSGYSQRIVAEYLSDLERAGFAEVRRAGGRQLDYSLTERLRLPEEDRVPYVDWATFLPAYAALTREAGALAREELSAFIASSRLRRALRDLDEGLEAEGSRVRIGDLAQHSNEGLVQAWPAIAEEIAVGVRG